MPIFNIHWKGYPHRRIPRFRVGSISEKSLGPRSIPCVVAPGYIQRPSNVKLERERKKQKSLFRRRRARKTRSSSAVRARKYASLKARQHIQVFGWDADLASKANTTRIDSEPPSIHPRSGPDLLSARQETLSETTVIDSHDGAGSSVLGRCKSVQPESLYSLMHVAEIPVYWSSKSPAHGKKSSIASSRALTRATRRPGEYAHPARGRNTYRYPQKFERSRTNDTKIDPRSLLNSERPKKSVPIKPPATRRTISRPSPSKASQGSLELRKVVDTMLENPKAGPRSVTSSMKSIVKSLFSDSASRTPSQRRALRQFIKELDLYLQATKALPKQSLVPSPSVTTVSAHTIEDLRPYKYQFRSAGLAVTAADQLRELSTMAKTKTPLSPPIPPKDSKYIIRETTGGYSKSGSSEKQDVMRHHHHKTESIPSFETGTTVMDFIPPHDQTGPLAATIKRRTSLSSDHTVMAFTPPYESSPQPKYAPPPAPRTTTKRSLPWLRKPEVSHVPPTSFQKGKSMITASTVKTKTRNPSDILLTFSITKDSVVEQTATQPKDRVPRDFEHHNAESNWQDTTYRNEPNTANNVDKGKRKFYNNVVIQAAPELSDNYAPAEHGFKYADANTQTSLENFGSSNGARGNSGRQNSVEGPTLIKDKSKTFSVSSIKYVGNCSRRTRGKKPSWKYYKDQVIKTDSFEGHQEIKQPDIRESESQLFKLTPQTPDPNLTSPFMSPSPPRLLAAIRSPNKSADEIVIRSTSAQYEPAETHTPAAKESPPPHPRLAQWPLRCTQCSAEIKLSNLESPKQEATEQEPAPQTVLEPNYELLPELEFEFERESPLGRKWSYDCTSSSSLECQQCAATRRGSSTASRKGLPLSPARSPQRESRHFLNRRAPLELVAHPDAEEAPSMPQVDEDIVRGYHSPEERFMQSQVVADAMAEFAKRPPVADPVKRPSLPKLRLRPSPQTRGRKQARTKSGAPLPLAPVFLDTVLPQPETITTASSLTREEIGTSDRAVFRGLHVATAAACDEDVAKWIEDITGTRIRRFLADLSAFDGLGFNTLAGVARRAAKQRRGEILAWERVREKRLQEMEVEDGWEDLIEDGKRGQ